MDFRFSFPDGIKEISTGAGNFYSINSLLFTVRQNPESFADESDIEVILNKLVHRNQFFAASAEVGPDAKYKCLGMYKRNFGSFVSGCAKSVVTYASEDINSMHIIMNAVIISSEDNNKCFISAIFPCDKYSEKNEEIFMDIVESANICP